MAHWRSGILVLLAGVALAGCSPLWQGALQGIADGARSPERLLVRNAPAELPNLLYVEGEGRAAVHVGVVSPQDPDLYWWAAPDGVTLSLRGGRLVATDGLPGDLRGLRWQGVSPLALLPEPALKQVALIKAYDALGGAAADTRYHYRFDLREDTVGVWGGEKRRLLRISELQTARPGQAPDWPGDRYWIDPASGLVWRAEVRYRPDRVLTLLPKTPWPWQSPALAGLTRPLPVNAEADPLTMRYRLDGSLRLHDALARLRLPDPLGVSLLQRQAVSEQRLRQRTLLGGLDQALSSSAAVRLPGLAAWRAAVVSASANGRVPLPADTALRLELAPTQNIVLQAGDVVVAGHRDNHVTVWDARLAQPCRADYQPWRPVQAYLKACLGDLALPDRVWLAGGDGRVSSLAVARWNRDPDLLPAPGLHVVSDLAPLARAAADSGLAEDMARLLSTQLEGGAAP